MIASYDIFFLLITVASHQIGRARQVWFLPQETIQYTLFRRRDNLSISRLLSIEGSY